MSLDVRTMRLRNEDGILAGDQLHLGFDRLQMAFPIRGMRKRARVIARHREFAMMIGGGGQGKGRLE